MTQKTRRRFLEIAGTAGIFGITGCVGGGNSESTATPKPTITPTRTATPKETSTQTATPTETPTDTPTETPTPRANPNKIFVAPDGIAGGPGTQDAPIGSIQSALERALPGDTVHVMSGEYKEPLKPPRSGEPDKPITITGPPDAVLKTSSDWYYPVEIRKSHIHLTGLTIDGLQNSDAPENPRSYSEAQLVQVRPNVRTDEYLTNIVISPHRIGNSQKSLVSLERTKNAEVGPFEVIGPAGADYLFSNQPGHNGEIIYIGTSPNNLGEDWHPWEEFDETNNVRVHHINASGGHGHAELVDLKPGTHHCTVEYCTSAGGGITTDDTTATVISHNGHHNTVRWNEIYNCPIAVEFDAGYPDWTHDNDLYGNSFHDLGKAAVWLEDPDTVTIDQQRHVCGNDVDQEVPDMFGLKAIVSTCSSDVPEGDGVGHTGGDSPWT